MTGVGGRPEVVIEGSHDGVTWTVRPGLAVVALVGHKGAPEVNFCVSSPRRLSSCTSRATWARRRRCWRPTRPGWTGRCGSQLWVLTLRRPGSAACCTDCCRANQTVRWSQVMEILLIIWLFSDKEIITKKPHFLLRSHRVDPGWCFQVPVPPAAPHLPPSPPLQVLVHRNEIRRVGVASLHPGQCWGWFLSRNSSFFNFFFPVRQLLPSALVEESLQWGVLPRGALGELLPGELPHPGWASCT